MRWKHDEAIAQNFTVQKVADSVDVADNVDVC